jgi:hypothetical protein
MKGISFPLFQGISARILPSWRKISFLYSARPLEMLGMANMLEQKPIFCPDLRFGARIAIGKARTQHAP